MKNKLVSILIAVLITVFAALFIVSASIALPILIRPFFYIQIVPLGLPEETELSYGNIKFIYDEMMDYCTGLQFHFSAGGLPFSEEGASHFADVKALFFVDFFIIGISAAALGILAIITDLLKIKPYRLFKRSPLFWSVVSIASTASCIGIACAIDFESTFILFHKIFFIGKENWAFNPHTDPIIYLLPNQFFANCGLFIFFGILFFSIAIMLYEFIPKRNKKITPS